MADSIKLGTIGLDWSDYQATCKPVDLGRLAEFYAETCPPELSRVRRAPHRLGVVQAFLNTLDVELQTDVIADIHSAHVWLSQSGLGTTSARLTRRDWARLADLRSVLRTLCGEHIPATGAPAAATFDAAVSGAKLTMQLDQTGRITLTPAGQSVDAIIGSLLTIVLDAQHDGTWNRLKICRNERCRTAFYDMSRSRTAIWCAMGTCGNRNKVAAHRRRHRTRQTQPDAK